MRTTTVRRCPAGPPAPSVRPRPGGIGRSGSSMAEQVSDDLRRVPEPPLPFLGADAVDAAGEAYQRLKTPDAAIGLPSAGVTLALAEAPAALRLLRDRS